MNSGHDSGAGVLWSRPRDAGLRRPARPRQGPHRLAPRDDPGMPSARTRTRNPVRLQGSRDRASTVASASGLGRSVALIVRLIRSAFVMPVTWSRDATPGSHTNRGPDRWRRTGGSGQECAPRLHECAPPLEQVRTPVGGLHPVPVHVGQRQPRNADPWPFLPVGYVPRGESHRHVPMRRALAGGQRVPTGGRRSKPSSRFFAVGVTPSRPAARDGAGVNIGVPWPARHPDCRLRGTAAQQTAHR